MVKGRSESSYQRDQRKELEEELLIKAGFVEDEKLWKAEDLMD